MKPYKNKYILLGDMKPYKNKYIYLKIIQGWFGRWVDLQQYAASSNGKIYTQKECEEYKSSLRVIRKEEVGTPIRAVFRRELNAYYARFPEKRPW